MGGFGGFNEKKKKKQKKDGKGGNAGAFSSAPVFVPPTVIKKGKREE